MPYPDNTSVTRHEGLDATKIWALGRAVADGIAKTLYGRADAATAVPRSVGLDVVSLPSKTNPNHAAIVNWPPDKHAQKSLAQQIAAKAVFFETPQA